MRLFLRSIFLFIVLVLLVSYPIAYFISIKFGTYNKQTWILKQKGLDLDYATLGSSRVYNMMHTPTLDSAYKKRGINLGTSGSCYAENYLLLSEFLTKNKIKRLILNTDEFSFNSENSVTYPFHEYELLPLFDKYKTIFNEYTPRWKCVLWQILPFSKYCEFNSEFTLKETSNSSLDESRGTELSYSTGHDMHEKKRMSEIKKLDEKYFNEILALCIQKKIKVILVTAPVFDPYKKETSSKFKKYITEIARSKNISYYSVDGLLNCADTSYFKDYTHTNAKGSICYSYNLGLKLNSETDQ